MHIGSLVSCPDYNHAPTPFLIEEWLVPGHTLSCYGQLLLAAVSQEPITQREGALNFCMYADSTMLSNSTRPKLHIW